MKKFLFLLSILIGLKSFSQNLYVTKTFSENGVYKSFLSEIDTSNGIINNNYLFSQSTDQSLLVVSPKYEAQSNSIYTFKGNKIYNNNGLNYANQTSFGGLPNALYPYREIIVINNRLFATRSINTSGMNYDLILYELNKNDGSIISSKTWSVVYTTNGYGTTVNEATSDIYNIIGNNVIKYNILDETSTIFNLSGSNLATSYKGIILANDRLFVRKADVLIHSLVEIDKTNGTVIASQVLTSNFENYYPSGNLVFLPESNEIVGSYYGLLTNPNSNKVLKFNIYTNTETILNLPTEIKTDDVTEDYWQLIVLNSSQFLASNFFESENENLKVKAVYNLLGQKVSLDVKNQILVIAYENGKIVKTINR